MADQEFEEHSSSPKERKPGPFLARVVSNIDPTYMGILEVEILRPVGGSASESQLHRVKYMSPFYGVTSVSFTGENNDYDDTQKSYGFWMVPPDTGATVVVFFIDGDPKRGYWIGCVPDDSMNFMVPGYAATQQLVDRAGPDAAGRTGRAPAAEYNKSVTTNNNPKDPETNKKATHPFADVLDAQGLLLDDIRGITTSSARREAPSSVYGISTPGPLDKRPGAKKGNIGKEEWKVLNAWVSRLGGSSFVMDDGDANWLRKKNASEGPPEYASIDAEERDGDVTLPANELIRLRTRTGHQILLHNTEDLIYITNSRGTAWIELTSDGKIDVYAQDSISFRTENDFNFYADRDFNIEVGRNFNLKVAERHQTEIGGNKILIVKGNNTIGIDGTKDETVTGAVAQSFEATWDVTTGDQTNITVGGGFDLNTSSDNKLTSGGNMEIAAANTTISGGNINLNGPGAASAGSASSATAPEPLPTFENPTPAGGAIESIMLRIPTTEPYPHHENLDPMSFKTDKTDRESSSTISTPDAWKTYSLAQDTFLKGKG